MDNVDENIKTPSVESDENENDTEVMLATLKAEADNYGIKYGRNIGVAKLQSKIQTFLENARTPKEVPKESAGQRKARLRKAASKLIRVKINCLNPNKREWRGEIISVGNGSIGTFKKFVPFGLEDGYHIPMIIYNYLKEREFQTFYTIKHPGKPDEKRGKLIKEFNIEVLSPLTPKELEALAKKQLMNNSIDAK